MGSSSKGFSYDVLPRLDPNPIEKSRYDVNPMTPMNIQATHRLADADRWDMADFLGDMYSQGVLTKEEYEARRDFALKAVTRAEVQALFRDIPKDMGAWKSERKMALAAREREEAQEQKLDLRPYVVTLAGLIIAWLGYVATLIFPAAFYEVSAFTGIGLMTIGIGVNKLIPKKKT